MAAALEPTLANFWGTRGMTIELLFSYSTRGAPGVSSRNAARRQLNGMALKIGIPDGCFGIHARTRRVGSAQSGDGAVKLWSVSGFLQGLS